MRRACIVIAIALSAACESIAGLSDLEITSASASSTIASASSTSSASSSATSGSGGAGGGTPCGSVGTACCAQGASCDAYSTCQNGVCTGCAAQISVGDDYACARKIDGTIWCWGTNAYGETGLVAPDDGSVPAHVKGLPKGAVDISAD